MIGWTGAEAGLPSSGFLGTHDERSAAPLLRIVAIVAGPTPAGPGAALQEALCRTRFSRPAREGAAAPCRPQPDTAANSKQPWSGRQRLVTTHRNKLWSERRWAWRGG